MLPLKDENPTHRFPIVTLALIVACLGIYFLWQPSPFGETIEDTVFYYEEAAVPCEITSGAPLSEDELRATLSAPQAGIPGDEEACGVGSDVSPEGVPDKSVWLSLLVSMFLHGGLLHLGGNMLFLWVFGNNIEDHLGPLRFLGFYLIGGLVASAAHILVAPDSTVPVVGASGAIAAVMGAYLVWFPDAPVRTLVMLFIFITLVDVRAKWLLGFWFVLQFFTDPNEGVAWVAHVGGFVFGVVIGLLIRASGGLRRVAWSRAYARQAGPWDETGGAGHRYGEIRRYR